MNTDKLAAMANQISIYFRSYPEDEGVAGVRTHIVAFWTPRMVEALRARAANDATGLEKLVVSALLDEPTGAESPTMKAAESARKQGAAASDAG